MTATEPSWQPPSRSAVLTPASWAVRHHAHGYKAASLNALTRPPRRCSAGGPVTPFEHNWVLFFEGYSEGYDYECGASLINEQWAMTAAHCTDGIAASEMKVLVHRHKLKKGGEHECAETVKISQKFEHPEYNDIALENDIALLRLSQVHPLPHSPRQIDAVSPLIISTFALHT